MKSKFFQMLMLAGVLCLSGASNHAIAQVDSGRITGQVLDAKNASIAGATITVKNERTNEERTATTNSDGAYQITALRPSFYTITVTANQFAPAEQTGLQLTVGQEIHRNFTMQLASVSSTISVVESVESAIDTTSARLGVNVNLREVGGLPLNGRQVSQLFLQAPGSTNSGDGTFGAIRFSGRATEQNAVRYDGVEGGGVIDSQPGVLNGEINTPFRLQSSLENVQEFRVESNNYPAEYGTGTGGQVSVITKSGSNSFHGSAYEYLRNDHLDAQNFFDVKKSELRLNQFGASLGGPIAKDKLFFYSYYEGYRLRAGINNIESVPSEAVRGLSACATGTTGGYGPGTNNCVNGDVQKLLGTFIGPGSFLLKAEKDLPGPVSGANGGGGFDIYQFSGLTTLGENSGGLRLDYHINNKHTLYARYFRDQGNWLYPEGVTGRTVAVIDNPQNGVLSLQSNLSNNMINEAKVGFNEALSRIAGSAPTTSGVDLSAIAISLSGSVANAGIAGQGSTTGIATPGALVRSNSASNGQAQPYTPYSISFIDNVSYLTGKHNIKFGAEVRLVRIYTDRIGGTTYSFSNLGNFLKDSISSISYLSPVSGISPYNSPTAATGNRLLKQQYYIGYVQDEFKIRPNLTLNYGLRYEYYSPLHEDRNLYVDFDTNTGVLSTPNYCQLPLLNEFTGGSNAAAIPPGACSRPSQPWYKGDTGNFGPRIGLAWQPFSSHSGMFGGERTVFRGGFGIFYGPGQSEDLLQPAESDRVWTSISSGKYCLDTAGCTTTPAILTNNFLTNPNNRSAQVRAYAPEYTVPERIFQYSASWQQQWGYQLVSTVAYVGSQGRNLFLRNIANRIVSVRDNTTAGGNAVVARQFSIDQGGNTVLNPYAEIDYKTSGGHDAYNALQTQLVRRSSNGLTLAAEYTFAKSFGNSSGSNEALTTGNPYDYNYDIGYNAFDIRHAFNLSALYDLPIGKNKHYMSNMNGIAEAVLGNWEVGTIIGARSGLPIDVRVVRPDVLYKGLTGATLSTGASIDGKYLSSPKDPITGAALNVTAVINTPGGGNSRNVRRPDLLPGVNPFLPNGYLNPAAFGIPAPGTFGNLQRGSLHGPSDVQADMTISKKFPLLRESTNLEIRAEIYNIFNHPNFANPPATINPSYTNGITPDTPLTSSSAGNGGVFGKFNQTVSNTVGTGTNRQIQLALRLNF
jgi:hypothetical protein